MVTRILVVLVVLGLCAGGCSSVGYLVVPNAPNTPRFVVLPFDQSTEQRAYADVVEQELMSFGFTVYSAGLEAWDVEDLETGDGEAPRIVELAAGSADGPATHVVQSFAKTDGEGTNARFREARLKIWEVDSKRVIATFPVKPHAERRYIYDALKEAGFPVEEY